MFSGISAADQKPATPVAAAPADAAAQKPDLKASSSYGLGYGIPTPVVGYGHGGYGVGGYGGYGYPVAGYGGLGYGAPYGGVAKYGYGYGKLIINKTMLHRR